MSAELASSLAFSAPHRPLQHAAAYAERYAGKHGVAR
jgi:hypothetical protein